MASTYSTNLKIELIATGEQASIWGVTTNTNLGTALEQAIVGKADIDMNSTTITLTLTNTNAAQDARAIYLNLTGTPGGAATLEVPAVQKPYIVKNGSNQVVTVKVSGQTGVAVPVGKTVLVYNNGTDVVTAVDHIPSLTLGAALPVASGGTGATTLTANNVVLGNGTSAVNFVAPGTSGNVLTSNGTTWTSAAGLSFASPLSVIGNNTAGAEIRLPEDTDNGSNYVALKAANNIASNVTFTLPDADGTTGQVLQTNGSGVLSFATVSSGPFPENEQVLTTDYTVPSGKNSMAVGPVTLNSGVSVTVGSGQKWLVFN